MNAKCIIKCLEMFVNARTCLEVFTNFQKSSDKVGKSSEMCECMWSMKDESKMKLGNLFKRQWRRT